jgi:hypothetical protein
MVTLSARLKVDVVDADRNDIALPLTAGATARITVSAEAGQQGAITSPFIGLTPWDTGVETYVPDGKDNHFSIGGLPLGPYRVVVGMPAAYAKTLRVDGVDSPDWIADLSTAAVHHIEIDIAFDGGTVTGYARDGGGNPAPKMLVTLVPKGNVPLTSPEYAVCRSDDQGRFLFTRVPPGSYRIFAWENVPAGAVQNRMALQPFENQAAQVDVQPGGSANVDVNVISAAATEALQ